MQRCVDALGADAIEFFDGSGYREQFCLYITQASLADLLWRPRIVAFVKALIVASEQLRRDPREAMSLVARAACIGLALFSQAPVALAQDAGRSGKPLRMVVPYAPGGPTDMFGKTAPPALYPQPHHLPLKSSHQ